MSIEHLYARAAAERAVFEKGAPYRMSPSEIIDTAISAAMKADRTRMAEMMRTRIMFNDHPEVRVWLSDLPEQIREAVLHIVGVWEATLLDIANQVEQGMPYVSDDTTGSREG